MSAEFESSADEHLQRLIENADRFIAAGDPLSLRLATLCIVDYYQAILKEAAAVVGLSLSSEKDLAGMINRLRTRVLGLDRISLDDLSKVRNATYHNESRYYAAAELNEHLSKGAVRRKFFLAAAVAAIRYEKVMVFQVQCLLATANEMKRELRTGSKEWRAHWLPRVERAAELAKSSPLALEQEGFELLLDLTRQVASSRAIDAMNAVEQGDSGDYEDEAGFEPDQGGPESGDYEPEPEPEPEPDPEPTEFEPSEYYTGEPDQEPPDVEPADTEPPDGDPSEQEPPDEGPPD